MFAAELVDQVIDVAGDTEQRNWSLPAQVMAYFSIGMALHSERSYEDVFAQLTDGLARSSGRAASWSPPGESDVTDRPLLDERQQLPESSCWHEQRHADDVGYRQRELHQWQTVFPAQCRTCTHGGNCRCGQRNEK